MSELCIIAIGTCLPYAQTYDQFKCLAEHTAPAYSPFQFSNGTSKFLGHQFNDIKTDFKKFAIPPLFRKAIASETYLALQSAEDAVSSINTASWHKDKVDVYCGTSLGFDATYHNATKISAVKACSALVDKSPDGIAFVDSYKEDIKKQFGCTSHDRVGEMASSIPARIAHFLKVRGKCQTIEALDLTGLHLLQLAQDVLCQPDSDVVILTTVQRFNDELICQLLTEKNNTLKDTLNLSEGAITLVVKRYEDACRDQDPILAILPKISVDTTSKIVTSEDKSQLDKTQLNAKQIVNHSQLGFSLSNHVFLTLAHQIAKQALDICITDQSMHQESWSIQCNSKGSVATTDIDSVEDIAIVSYATFAGSCQDKNQLWNKLVLGEDDIGTLPESRLNQHAFARAGTAQKLSTYAVKGSYLRDLDKLDELLPKPIMPIRRRQMDDIQKLSLICATNALSNTSLTGKCGVILASNLCLSQEKSLIVNTRYKQIKAINADIPTPEEISITSHTLPGLTASGSARLISQIFNLNAQCYAVEAACASSLAAIHNGVRALQSNRLDSVLVGGFELPANERDMVLCSAQMMLSKNKIAPFSKNADGFSPGDGGALFILKRLSDAKKSNDQVLSIIKAVSGSCDAKSMTAPDVDGQALAMRKTLSLSDVNASDIQVIEAHGTGTTVGDTVEIESIKQVYASPTRPRPLQIGSVKFNFGHCFAGSGSVGLSKLLLSIEHKQIPTTPFRSEKNADLFIEKIPAEITQKNTPWLEKNQYAALNSFGTGGLNYHLILQKEN
jgi:acyl transferase domain-containing protein